MELKQVTITLTAQELNIIGLALGNMPYKDSVSVIQSIEAQVNAALKNATPPLDPEPPCPPPLN